MVELSDQAAYTLDVCNERNRREIFLIDETYGVRELASHGLFKIAQWDQWQVVAQVTDAGRAWLAEKEKKHDAQ